MSKKRRKQIKQFPWWLIVIIGAMLITAGFGFARQRSSFSDEGTPAIAVDQRKIDYGNVKLNTDLSFTLKITNTGDGVLRFKDKPYIEVVDGC
jgi:hypothetical protein